MIKYDTTVQPGTSHALMLELVGGGKDVLDVGCATGYLAAALTRAGNRVRGVEADPASAVQAREHAEEVVVADLEDADLVAHFGPAAFDAVVFGDVLEHLRDPAAVLRGAVPLLRPGGSVVVSVPNVAHGSVRLALLQGTWRYRDLGLLDETHVRFLTRATLDDLLAGAGLVAVDRRRTAAPPLGTEVEVDPSRLPPGVLEWVEADEDAWTYQFVVRAVRDDAEGAARALARRADEGEAEASRLRAEAARLAGEVAAERERRSAAEAELAAVHATRTMRATRGLRRAYGAARRALGGAS